ncbi:hypothetical protein RvY_19077 [Ramazzottius varieornatus]|uniref:Uncharacterized protein n=1 Tax=Ramazzottius varieornatus TaxID=947166 RepID=A0A1D1W884_RAMVA|nr:hypothetical protein RvY_19077 [Ramazzottius varieornatus]
MHHLDFPHLVDCLASLDHVDFELVGCRNMDRQLAKVATAKFGNVYRYPGLLDDIFEAVHDPKLFVL